MNQLKTIMTVALVSCFSTTSLRAQDAGAAPTPPAPYNCAIEKGFSDFDFWLGDWDVVANGNSKPAGTNRVTKESSGCFIYESWKNIQGIPGNSMNYYNPLTEKWRQLWLGSGGNVIDISGSLVDGSMVLVGTITTYNNGKILPFRGIWTLNEDGSVRQFFEQQNNADGKWSTWFDGKYIRQK